MYVYMCVCVYVLMCARAHILDLFLVVICKLMFGRRLDPKKAVYGPKQSIPRPKIQYLDRASNTNLIIIVVL